MSGTGSQNSSQSSSSSETSDNSAAAKVMDYTEESSGSKFERKFKENPFFPVAIAGFTGAAIYGLAGIRKRGDTPLSLYLIQLRVGAQGLAVGTLALGVCYILGKRLYNMSQGIDSYDPKAGR